MTSKKQIGEDLGVWYEDEAWVAAYGHIESLEQACWEVVETLWSFYWEKVPGMEEHARPEERARFIALLAGHVKLNRMWGKKRPCSTIEQEDGGGAWVLLEKKEKPEKGWFPFTRLELVVEVTLKCFNCGYDNPILGNAKLRAMTGNKPVCIPCLAYYQENKRWPSKEEREAYWTKAKTHEILEGIVHG